MLSLVGTKSQALLIGASRFPRDEALLPLPAVRNNLTDLSDVLSDQSIVGIPPQRITVIQDEASASTIAETIDAVGRDAEDTLILYYAGHGMVSSTGELLLATAGSTQARASYNSLALGTVKHAILSSPAAKKIIIMDCCFSGRAVQLMTETESLLRAELDVRGTYAIASAPANKPAMAPEGERNTAFTRELLRAVKNGVDNGQEALELDEIYGDVRGALLRDGLPEPQRMNAVNVRPFYFCRNRYYSKRPLDETRALEERVRAQAAEIDQLKQLVHKYEGAAQLEPAETATAIDGIVRGVTKVTNMVRPTLGPHSKSIAQSRGAAGPSYTQDSAVIVGRTKLSDPFEIVGVDLARELVKSTRAVTGDGFATGLVIAERILVRLRREYSDGLDLFSLAEDVRNAIAVASAKLVDLAQDVEQKSHLVDLVHTATGDRWVTDIVADAIDQVGVHGDVTVEVAHAPGVHMELVQGIRFDGGWASPYFHTVDEEDEGILDQPYVLVCTSVLSAVRVILPVMEEVMATHRPLLVVAKDVFGEALATLVVNHIRGSFRCAAVRAAEFGDRAKAVFQDIATVTGAVLVDEESGVRLQDITFSMLGRAQRVVVSPYSTTIVGGRGAEADVSARRQQIRSKMQDAVSITEREFLQARLARLGGGIARIRIGGAAEAVLREKRVLIERSAKMARSAVEGGITPGGGASLIRCQDALPSAKAPRSREIATVAVRRALEEPLRQIALSAGQSPDEVVERVKSSRNSFGFDASTGNYSDLNRAGIIDSVKVLRSALEGAGTIVGLAVTRSQQGAEEAPPDSLPLSPADWTDTF